MGRQGRRDARRRRRVASGRQCAVGNALSAMRGRRCAVGSARSAVRGGKWPLGEQQVALGELLLLEYGFYGWAVSTVHLGEQQIPLGGVRQLLLRRDDVGERGVAHRLRRALLAEGGAEDGALLLERWLERGVRLRRGKHTRKPRDARKPRLSARHV